MSAGPAAARRTCDPAATGIRHSRGPWLPPQPFRPLGGCVSQVWPDCGSTRVKPVPGWGLGMRRRWLQPGLNLPAREARVALQRVVAVGAVEFEFVHGLHPPCANRSPKVFEEMLILSARRLRMNRQMATNA